MGLYHSRFIEALKKGSEDEARQLYSNRKSVRDSIDPNSSLGPTHNENSVLHYAALHAMEWLYRDLLTKGGKPDQRNAAARNCLHLVCSQKNRNQARATILLLTIHEGLTGMDVEHVLRERDEEGNTALHLAASAGLRTCVEYLLDNKADPYVTNKKEQTAADCAAESKRSAIATLLETRMVFTAEDDGSSANAVEPDHTHLMELAEAPSGMRDSDLRSMKDQLLIETSELLGVSLFTSEALLRHHGWSKEQLLEAWMEDPTEVCEKAGVQLPANLGTHNLDTPATATLPRSPGEEGEGEEERECGVCVVNFTPDIEVPCGHVFCRDCWREYLHQKIEAGDAHSIVCPEYGCFKLVPIEVIEAVVSREMAQRYLQFDIKAFVESHPTIRWCPYPDCHRAVRMTTPTDTPTDAQQSTTVHCGNEHYFCWNCSGEPHVPMSCDDWRKWLDHVQEMAPQIGDRTASQLDDAASQRWLATRSKPCPKCRAPIEKNDGCNHMCCKKCKHDFCWVCLDEWKQHNTSTGGYFECNRYDVRRKADNQLEKRKEEVMEGVEEVEKLRRFIHYYERYKTHRQNLQLEMPFLEKVNLKSEKLRASVQKMDTAARCYTVSVDMSFIEEAIRELLASRRVLIASYPFGYYVDGHRARRFFENIQGSLEQATELLAQVVARPHLRKPRVEIIRLTSECREKRKWLVKDCHSLPDPTPPTRHRRLPLFGVHDDSPPSSSDEIENAFLRQLRDLRPHHHRRRLPGQRGRGEGSDLEQQLQQAMELSRQEHQEKIQLEADIERAKQLSLADARNQPTAHSGLLFLEDTPPPRREYQPTGGFLNKTATLPQSEPRPSHLHRLSFPVFPSPSSRTHQPSIFPPPSSRTRQQPVFPPPSSRTRQQPVFPTFTSRTHQLPTREPPRLPYLEFLPPHPRQTSLHSALRRYPSPPSSSSSSPSPPPPPSSPPPPPSPPPLIQPSPPSSLSVNPPQEENDDVDSSSSGGGWDEEELARALSLSLMEATPPQPHPSNSTIANQDPPWLRHLH